LIKQVTENIFLTELRLTDAAIIVAHMRDKEISDNTLVIPFPYSIEHANTFLQEETGVQKNFAIRTGDGELMGIIGIHFNYGLDADKSEFGYWLAKKYWNQGVMTKVTNAFEQIVKEKYKIKTLEACVFYLNHSSMRVLEKCGFTKTGDTITHTKKLTGEKVIRVGQSKRI